MTQKTILPYDPNLKKLARQLRNNSTMSEVLLWRCLKGNQVLGYDFDRQKPIDKYIVDFYCRELSTIEIDGSTHDNKLMRTDEAGKLESRMRLPRLKKP